MVLTIFGSTEPTGKELVKQSLFRGHTVRAFGRNVYTAGFNEDKKLQLIQGALFDHGQVYAAIKGSSAVLCVPPAEAGHSDKTSSLGMKIITAQMAKADVQRIIAIGDTGQLNATDDDMIMNMATTSKKNFAISVENFKAYQFLKESSLSWTFICAPEILEAEVTGLYHTNTDYLPVPNNNIINSGDLAMFLLEELEKNQFIHHRVGISN